MVLVGDGPVFCAGIDLKDPTFGSALAGNTDPARAGLAFQSQLAEMQDAFTALEACPVPVIAAVHGPCLGAGVDLVSAADIRLASSEATFSVREVVLGLAADVGTLQRLPKIVGNESWVREVCLTGRVFDADEALRVGLVSRVSPRVVDDALRLAHTISQHSPVAVVGTKRALLYARDHSVGDGLAQISQYSALALQSPDFKILQGRKAKGSTKPEYANLHPQARL